MPLKHTSFHRLLISLCLASSAPLAYAFVDVTAPVITAIDAIEISPTTPVVSIDIAADDLMGVDDAIEISEDTIIPDPENYSPTGIIGLFAPGTHTLEWTATDAAANSHTVNQTINILPTVNISADQTMGEGGSAQVCVQMNGLAPTASYPVVIPYTVGGTATAADHDAANGNFNIAAGDKDCISIAITADADAGEGETITLTLGAMPANTVLAGEKAVHTITITEINLAPVAKLAADQGGPTRVITTNNGLVTINANASDPNGSAFSYDWSTSDNTLLAIASNNGDNITFNPLGLAPGNYSIRLRVSDGVNSSNHSLLIAVSDTPVLSSSDDTDNDGSKDDVEGISDGDNDGISNYLDALNVPYLLQTWPLAFFNSEVETSKSYSELNLNYQWRISSTPASNLVMYTLLANVEPGLKLSLGNLSFLAGLGHARLRVTSIATMLNATAPANRTPIDGHMLDVKITGMSTPGQTVHLVYPQTAPIPPADAPAQLYIIDASSNFAVFDSTASNEGFVTTFTNANGYCAGTGIDPSNGNYGSYGTTLDNTPLSGHQCLLMAVTDGGPNDRDGEANGSILLTAGVFIPTIDPTTQPPPLNPPSSIKETVNPGTRTDGGFGSGASGSLGGWSLAGLISAWWLRRRQWSLIPPKRRVSRCPK